MLKLLILVAAIFLASNSASATTCWPEGGQRAQVRAAFDQSSFVFSAYVLEVSNSGEAPIAKVSVLQVWKGEIEVGQVVETTASDSVYFMGDGVIPLPGTALLIYSPSELPQFLHVCSRTRQLDYATGDIPLLNNFSKKQRYKLGG
ncbi:hypothetical protein [Arenimonas sp.]|uniref:hypothetical protein n=1 Tax=Arenimonas sp. TaxID=1872635 RepID=UPI0025C5684B|nr:hypothetical protein [Arenimonas sp.]